VIDLDLVNNLLFDKCVWGTTYCRPVDIPIEDVNRFLNSQNPLRDRNNDALFITYKTIFSVQEIYSKIYLSAK